MEYFLFTDGGSRGNPGNSAAGCFIFDSKNKLIDVHGEYLGKSTNNSAEYNALILGLKLAKKNKIDKLKCHLDSELIVKQINGQYKVNHEDMKKLYSEVQKLILNFDAIEFVHVPRKENKFADKMVNLILDSK